MNNPAARWGSQQCLHAFDTTFSAHLVLMSSYTRCVVAYVVARLIVRANPVTVYRYTGSCFLDVAGTRLQEAAAASNSRDISYRDGTLYPSSSNISATQVTRTTVRECPSIVAGRLFNRFARILRLGPHYGERFGWRY